ncbi:glycerol-3-phosphate dehydrogenase [Massilia forsythiae]|uniref:Glycerol-3-phosphate dehydrogenase n=1 Tax=Massilia forsythiae TaxID=2728020 RepID=A0A7Z2VYY4_9BURK|nr:glycerol-3-phosphate dehydrogenase [Massilia forsythiae]QJE01665.1 glycerol-3-phosphate dehydrogenase [Massilia forsythiae]
MDGQARRIDCDVLVVGGGINGAGIARDAAGRGLRVLLCEQDDLASHTSSASSKLIHGGLRYLEQYQFGLVRKALAEREILLRSAPHIMRPLRFAMPHAAGGGDGAGQRPAWMVRAGLFLYDHLARRDFLPGSCSIALRGAHRGQGGAPLAAALAAPLQPHFAHAFLYSDAWVDDARLVVLAALDARERGATVLTRTRCTALERGPARWSATLRGVQGAESAEGLVGEIRVQARCVVNAAGPWAARFLQAAVGGAGAAGLEGAGGSLRLVKGSHIVVPRLFAHDHAYLLQQPDGRIVFALPYEEAFTLVGTTDVDYDGDPGRVAIGAAETAYLCEAANRCFQRRIGPADVVWSFAGVRPLIGAAAGASAARVSRDYRLHTDTRGAPLLSVFGGKVTTFRKLAEQAVDWIAPALGRRMPGWTAHACLPGGDLFGRRPDVRGVLEFDAWLRTRRQQYAWVAPALLARWARAYGTRIGTLLAHCRMHADLGEEVAPGLFEVELDYLRRHEWAQCADDVLWRRTKLGLHVPADSVGRVDAWLAAGKARSRAAHMAAPGASLAMSGPEQPPRRPRAGGDPY